MRVVHLSLLSILIFQQISLSNLVLLKEEDNKNLEVFQNKNVEFVLTDEEIKKAVEFNKGGSVLVDYAPRGTDTVPAMLTPGEFVVNREATKKNLGLLKAINKSSSGQIKNGVLYAENGAGPIGGVPQPLLLMTIVVVLVLVLLE